MVLSHQKFDFGDKCLIERVSIQAPFRFSVDFPNEACFIYFGEGHTKINSPAEQIKIEPKESVLLKCGSYFSDLIKYPAADQYEILVVHLYPDMLRKIYQHEIPSFIKHSNSNDKPFINKVGSQEVVKKFIESLYFYFDNPALVSDELLELKVKELMLLLIQTNNAESVMSLLSDLFTPRQVGIKEVVNNHLFSNLSIEDLARLANLSVSTFKRNFHELFHDTPANYIKNQRLERAKELLAISTLTISEIAFQTCFHDVAHFSRSFKSAYGCSPSAYRVNTIKS